MKSDIRQIENIPLGRKIVYLAILFVVCFFLVEGALRGYSAIRNMTTGRDRVLDDKFGWVTVANVNTVGHVRGYGEVRYSTTKYGFREFGDTTTTKPKIFVIGDSYTEARTVSDGQAYYSVLGELANAEIFAYGSGGYGTLQEYMILDEYYDLIQPDIILWQLCGNDITNNSFDLEAASLKDNNYTLRPYYENGEIEYRFPHRSWLYRNVLRHSHLIKLLSTRLNILTVDQLGSTQPETSPEQHLHYKQAVKTTADIFRLAKRRAGDTPIIAFAACGGRNDATNQTFARIFKELSIPFTGGVLTAMSEAAAAGRKVDGSPYDAHWNATGHVIAGEKIFEFMRDEGIFD